MSLLNQMLQDLDARRAAQGVGNPLPNAVRPLPKPQASRLPMVLGMLVLTFLAGGSAFLYWEIRQETAHSALSGVPPLALAPAVLTAASPPPLAQLAAEPLKSLPAEAALPAGLAAMDGGPRMSADSVGSLPQPQSEVKPATASSVVENRFAGDRSKLTAIEQPLTAPPPQGENRSARMPLIERSDALGSSADRPETEYRKAIASLNQGAVAEALEGLRNALRQDGSHVASRQVLVSFPTPRAGQAFAKKQGLPRPSTCAYALLVPHCFRRR